MRELIERLILTERVEPLTANKVKALRKDFLTLMKNVKILSTSKDLEKIDKWRSAMVKWGALFEELATQIKSDIESRIRGQKYNQGPELDQDWAEHYLKTMGPVWGLAHRVSSPPGSPLAYYRDQNRKMRDWWTDDRILEPFMRDIKSWERRTRDFARKAWKWLEEVAEWSQRTDRWGGGGEVVTLNMADDENVSLAGFKVKLKGYTETDFNRDLVNRFQRGLEFYKKRASKVFPAMLRLTMPFVMDFLEHGGNAAASYEGDHIEVNFWGSHNKPREVAKIIAHEMGHRIWRSLMSDDARNAWRVFVRGSSEDLDLRAVMRKWGDVDERKMMLQDPVMYLQVQTLLHSPAYKDYDLYSMKRIRSYVDSGQDPIVKVTTKPITGYGAKSPEEGFCEALGLLVAYGPKTVLPEVRRMINVFFPRLKMEDAEVSMGSLIESLRGGAI